MATHVKASSAEEKSDARQIFFIVNGMFDNKLAGGDIHLLYSIRALTTAGWQAAYLGTHRLDQHLKAWNLPGEIIFTDHAGEPPFNNNSLKEKCRLWWEFFRRFFRALGQLHNIETNDVCFCPSDYWFDVLPVVLCRARLKIVVLHMQAPSFKEVLFGKRIDIKGNRIASLHYCLSQWLSLKALRFCRNKRVVVVQPLLRPTLWRLGFKPEETPLIPNGVDDLAASQTADGEKSFDVAWIGRIHRQKGIDDLLQTLKSLAGQFPDFRAVLIGDLAGALGESIAKLGLSTHVHFTGYVSGTEKFQWLKKARVYLMPSHHEGLPIVIGEALACGVPVVAYELEMYRPFYGHLLTYVKPFDQNEFNQAAADAVRRTRSGMPLMDAQELVIFQKNNSWTEVGKQLAALLSSSSSPINPK